MPRIPYVFPENGESQIADKIRERRKDGKLINLDGMFLNAPEIASGYNALVGAIRSKNSLDDGLRELLILRVAALNGAAYEWKAHEPVGRAGGLTTAQLKVIRDIETSILPASESPLTPLQSAALAYTDASTRTIKIPQAVFDELKSHLNNQQIVEVTATIGAYNLVSRFLVALDVNDMADAEVPWPE